MPRSEYAANEALAATARPASIRITYRKPAAPRRGLLARFFALF